MQLINQKHPYQEALDKFLSLCHIRSYPSKTTIIRPGDIGDKLLFIVKGSVTVSVEDLEGKELILSYLNQHDFIGEVGIFKPCERREVFVKTRLSCQLAEISYTRFKDVLKKELSEHSTDILYMLGEQLSTRLLITSRNYQDLAFMDVENRIARTLINLAREPDAITHPDGMQLHITRQEIGRIVGCSREMAGRVLKALEKKGKIEAHGKTIVVYGTR